MRHTSERTRGYGTPGDFERRGGRPDEGVCPGRGIDGGGGRGSHAGVALERAAAVDGEEEDDVAAGLVGFGEGVEVLLLGGPCALWMGDVRSRMDGWMDDECGRWEAFNRRKWEMGMMCIRYDWEHARIYSRHVGRFPHSQRSNF